MIINKLMKHLSKAEGWQVHKNKTEKDITAFCGIYRKAHPNFKGWWWLDSVAEMYHCAGYRDSKKAMKELNRIIANDETLRSMYDHIAMRWHRNNAAEIGLEKFPDEKTAITYFSLHTNSPRGAGKSLQRAINDMSNTYLKIDGVVGSHTLHALSRIKDAKKLNKLILMYMQDYYNSLIRWKPEKYRIYANGWTNRLKGLA